jgi:DNA-binding CsgD family transcriptional regulator
VALGSPTRLRGTPRQPAAVLTERELLVLRFLPSRLTNAEITRECVLSVNTVKANLKNIYAKLGVSSRAETVERALARPALTGNAQPPSSPSASPGMVRRGEPSWPRHSHPSTGANRDASSGPAAVDPPGC